MRKFLMQSWNLWKNFRRILERFAPEFLRAFHLGIIWGLPEGVLGELTKGILGGLPGEDTPSVVHGGILGKIPPK